MTDGRMEMTGVVTDFSKDIFKVQVSEQDGGQLVTCRLSGKMRQNKINLAVGDHVRIEVSPYDITMGRITFRLSGRQQVEQGPSVRREYSPPEKKRKIRRIPREQEPE